MITENWKSKTKQNLENNLSKVRNFLYTCDFRCPFACGITFGDRRGKSEYSYEEKKQSSIICHKILHSERKNSQPYFIFTVFIWLAADVINRLLIICIFLQSMFGAKVSIKPVIICVAAPLHQMYNKEKLLSLSFRKL